MLSRDNYLIFNWDGALACPVCDKLLEKEKVND